MSITIRPMRPGDRDFVRSGWASSLRASTDIALIPDEHWAAIMHPVIDFHLDRRHVTTLVAASATVADVLDGFITFSGRYRGKHREYDGYVYYVYVPQPCRGHGIARSLLEASGIKPDRPFGYACSTRATWEIKGGIDGTNRIPRAIYDPMHARRSAGREAIAS